jgi:ADP-ribose pyrophosphatase
LKGTSLTDDYPYLRERGLTQESVYRGDYLKVRMDTVALPNGEVANREIVEHPGAIAVVPVDADGQVVLVRQYRYPIGEITLEIPAGKLEWGESPEVCTQREMAEEVGLKAAKLERLTEIVPAPGYSNERLVLFKATGLEAVEHASDPDEFLEVVRMPLKEALKLVKKGEITDAKTIIGLNWVAG